MKTSCRPLSIFVVENHPDTRKWLKLYLEGFGHQIVTAGSMAEAVAEFPSSGCQVVLSDIGLPDGTGWDLLPQLTAVRPTYAIAMSGFGTSADVARSRAAGFQRHMLKPIEPEDLARFLEEAAGELPET